MRFLITGGAGFIGANAARRLLDDGHEVCVLDNLSRPGGESNLKWLGDEPRLRFIRGDVRDHTELSGVVRAFKPDVVLHLAAQVAVTTSVHDPRHDFEVNAYGTFNVCEAIRTHAPHALLLNASTNKVYGELTGIRVTERGDRYAYESLPAGVDEQQPLDFHSPYGCSKGAADQYVHDYARIYGVRTINFRQSCIYGRRQFGIEDQGWLAWFIIAAISELPITIYGDGKQVRDVLFVDDLIDCYVAAVRNIESVQGMSFNIGGGMSNTLSLRELVKMIETRLNRTIEVTYADWRPGDQRIYVSNIAKAEAALEWSPSTNVHDGFNELFDWALANRDLFADLIAYKTGVS